MSERSTSKDAGQSESRRAISNLYFLGIRQRRFGGISKEQVSNVYSCRLNPSSHLRGHVQNLLEAQRRVRSNDQLLQNAVSVALLAVGQGHLRLAKGLDVQVGRGARLDVLELELVVSDSELAFVSAVGPFGVTIANALHMM